MSTYRLRIAALTLTVLAGLALPAAPAHATASETRIDLGAEPGTIVIKTAERKLYLVTDTDRALVYDIAVGKPVPKGAQRDIDLWTA